MLKMSLTQKYLPKDCWEWMVKRTSYGTNILDCCRSALQNPDSNVGLYAQDPECYDLFGEIFQPLISEYHKIESDKLRSVHDLGRHDICDELPENMISEILSTRVRVGRTVKGFPMAGKLTKQQRLTLETKIKEALSKLTGELSGTYRSLCEMTQEERDFLVEEHLLFADADDRFLEDAGGYHDWPSGRGMFMNDAKTFIVWVNEEDHIRLISMQNGPSLKEVWRRLVNGIRALENLLEFEKHDKFGYLTFCPTNVGTALRASVHVRVPKLADSEKLEEVASNFNLQLRGFHGEQTYPTDDGVYDISNKCRIGKTEWELVNMMWDGIKKLLEHENNI